MSNGAYTLSEALHEMTDLVHEILTEYLMHEIRHFMQGFTVSKVTNNVVYNYTYVYSIFSPYCGSFWQKLSQYDEKILYTYVYHIVS